MHLLALGRGSRHKGSTESHGSQLRPGPHSGAWAPDWPSAALPHRPLIMYRDAGLLWGSPAAFLTWGLAELCLFRLFSKQSKHVTDGGGSCLKTPCEAGIECLGGVTASWWAPLEAVLMGRTSFLPKSLRLRDLPAPALPSLRSQAWVSHVKDLRGRARGSSFNPLALLVGAHSSSLPSAHQACRLLTTCRNFYCSPQRHCSLAGMWKILGVWQASDPCVLAPGWECRLSGPGLLTSELGQCSSTARGPVWPLHPLVPPP